MDPILENPGAEDQSDSTSLSSAASCGGMGRQVSEFSEAACTEIFFRQCSAFKGRGEFRRSCSEMVQQLGPELGSQWLRQASSPAATGRLGLATIEDDASSSAYSTLYREPNPNAEPGIMATGLIEAAITAAMSDCSFPVCVADPADFDSELVAVSREFELLTGYSQEEAVGENCRFLNQDCELDPELRDRLRETCENGVPFTAAIPNRRKSGEQFVNFLDLRGLVLAQNPRTSEDLWLLVGVQADVTDLSADEMPQDHMAQLQQAGSRIRRKMLKQMAAAGMSGALMGRGVRFKREVNSQRKKNSNDDEAAENWYMLPDVTWKSSHRPNANGNGAHMRELGQERGNPNHTNGGTCSIVIEESASATNLEDESVVEPSNDVPQEKAELLSEPVPVLVQARGPSSGRGRMAGHFTIAVCLALGSVGLWRVSRWRS